MATIGAALFILVPPVGGFVAFLGLNWVPWRTLTVPGVAFGWGVVLLLAAVLTPVVREVTAAGAGRIVGAASSILLVLAVVFALPTLVREIESGAMRMNMMTSRDAVVVRQLEQDAGALTIHPAPPLAYPTDSRDFEFLEVQNKDWFYPGYRDWFRVPDDAALVYDTEQPIGYCVDDERVKIPGVSTCAELGASRSDDREASDVSP